MGSATTNGRKVRGTSLTAIVAAALALGTLCFVGTTPAGANPTSCGSGVQTTNPDGSVTCTYGYTGTEQTFTVPSGVTDLSVTATGASSGAYESSPEPGASITGDISVVAGEILYVEVGGTGNSSGQSVGAFNGGGWGQVAGGGGASDVQTESLGNVSNRAPKWRQLDRLTSVTFGRCRRRRSRWSVRDYRQRRRRSGRGPAE